MSQFLSDLTNLGALPSPHTSYSKPKTDSPKFDFGFDVDIDLGLGDLGDLSELSDVGDLADLHAAADLGLGKESHRPITSSGRRFPGHLVMDMDRVSEAGTPEPSLGGTPPPTVLDKMSMVSPPFSPTDSQVDLVRRFGTSSASAREVPPLRQAPALDVRATRRVRGELDDELPVVVCESRARIPTTNGTEIFLHVYRNNVDNKEHLAIVFGADIHSKSLFEVRPGETEQDRMTRGAYFGRLYPGRQSSADDSKLVQDTAGFAGSGAVPGAGGAVPGASGAYSGAVPGAPGAGAGPEKDTLVRIHSECYTGETAWSARCDCGEQLDEAARLMALQGRGCIVYLRQEGRGIGLGEKLKAYNLQDLGADTVQANLMLRHPADARSFGLATAILLDLGLEDIRLLTNNPDKIAAVEGKHKEVHVSQVVPMVPLSWQNKGGFRSDEVDKYLATKVQRMGHLLDLTGHPQPHPLSQSHSHPHPHPHSHPH